MIFLFTLQFIGKDTRQGNINVDLNGDALFHVLNTPELPIGIFYDDRYSEPWNFNAQPLTNYLNQTLKTYNLTVYILNATALRNFMESNPTGIIVVTMGILPSNIWNGSENSFVEAWLDNGGIIIWTGCEEFYWMGTDSGENIPIGHVGSTYVLDMNYLETISNLYMTPTQIGNDLLNNLSSHTTDVFSSISSLIAANVHFEIYAKNGDYADPVLFQPKDGKGYFVRIHADWDDQLSVYNLSTWISSFIYNRFFNLPLVTDINSISSLFLLTSKQLFINVTNFSGKFYFLQINSTSDGFFSTNTSITISPLGKTNINLTISPLPSARFQQYKMTLNFFSNYTNSENESKIAIFFSKNLFIYIRSPLTIEILDIVDVMYPGNTYTLTCSIQKYINESISIDIILISEGFVDELKTNLYLIENKTTHQITFSIEIMAKSGQYEIYLRVYQNNILYSTSTVSIQIQSLFQNPGFLLLLFLITGVIVTFLGIYLFKRKRRMTLERGIIKFLESKNKVFLKDLSKILNIDMIPLRERINSCLTDKKIDGYLIRDEKKEFLYIKKRELYNFVLNTISKLKTNDIYQISEILNLSPSEVENILSSQIRNP